MVTVVVICFCGTCFAFVRDSCGIVQDVTSYYIDMSAAAAGKIAGLRTPTLAVASLDDPIMTADGSPIAELKNIQGLFILLTRCVPVRPRIKMLLTSDKLYVGYACTSESNHGRSGSTCKRHFFGRSVCYIHTLLLERNCDTTSMYFDRFVCILSFPLGTSERALSACERTLDLYQKRFNFPACAHTTPSPNQERRPCGVANRVAPQQKQVELDEHNFLGLL